LITLLSQCSNWPGACGVPLCPSKSVVIIERFTTGRSVRNHGYSFANNVAAPTRMPMQVHLRIPWQIPVSVGGRPVAPPAFLARLSHYVRGATARTRPVITCLKLNGGGELTNHRTTVDRMAHTIAPSTRLVGTLVAISTGAHFTGFSQHVRIPLLSSITSSCMLVRWLRWPAAAHSRTFRGADLQPLLEKSLSATSARLYKRPDQSLSGRKQTVRQPVQCSPQPETGSARMATRRRLLLGWLLSWSWI